MAVRVVKMPPPDPAATPPDAPADQLVRRVLADPLAVRMLLAALAKQALEKKLDRKVHDACYQLACVWLRPQPGESRYGGL